MLDIHHRLKILHIYIRIEIVKEDSICQTRTKLDSFNKINRSKEDYSSNLLISKITREEYCRKQQRIKIIRHNNPEVQEEQSRFKRNPVVLEVQNHPCAVPSITFEIYFVGQ